MSRLKPYRRPDDDPLEVTGHERFERACLRPGELKTYGQFLNEPAAPGWPPYPIVLWNELAEMTSMKERERHLQQRLYEIGYMYGLPRAVVEFDMGQAMVNHIEQNIRRAVQEGRLVELQ